jgi:hypothetical protein
VADSCEHSNEFSCFMKCLDLLGDPYLLKKDFATWSSF